MVKTMADRLDIDHITYLREGEYLHPYTPTMSLHIINFLYTVFEI